MGDASHAIVTMLGRRRLIGRRVGIFPDIATAQAIEGY